MRHLGISLLLLLFTGCSSINEHGSDEVFWGTYGNAWRCSSVYINNSGNTDVGILNDFTDLLFKPMLFAFNTATFRFVWGTNSVANYVYGLGSMLPGYSHCDTALWNDIGLRSNE